MEQCPEVTASWVSKLFFCWLSPIFRKGRKRPLTEADTFPLNPAMGSRRLTDELEHQWQKQLKTGNPSLIKAILKQHAKEILLLLSVFVIEGVARTTATYLSIKVVSYFDPESGTTQSEAFLMAGYCLAVNLYLSVSTSYFFYRMDRIGAYMRIGATGLIYRKCCRLSQAELADKSIGHILTLITNDTQRLDEEIIVVSPLLGVCFVVPLAYFMLAIEIGYVPASITFATMLLAVPGQVLLGRAVVWLRGKTAPITDERVKLINEVFTSMKVIKMYGWEIVFKDMIEKVRAKEIFYIGLLLITRGINLAVLLIWAPVLTLMVTSAYMFYTGQIITMTDIFTLLSIVLTVRNYLHMFLGFSFSVIAQFCQTLTRIQTFLFCDEVNHLGAFKGIQSDVDCVILNPVTEKLIRNDTLSMNNATVSWGQNQFTLSHISVDIRPGEIVAIVGPVGCGKTTLLMAFLDELDHKSGVYKVPGNAGYASQIPWIYDGTVEENILFNRTLDSERLKTCIEACCLRGDLELLPDGLYTLVGERGVQLSGGQRARVSLARAVYGTENIMLLDDPLSAVDSKIANQIFNNLIEGYIASRTRVLVTHATQFLPRVDRIIMMNLDKMEDCEGCRVGRVTHVGTFVELVAQGVYLTAHDCDPNVKKPKLIEFETSAKKDSFTGEGVQLKAIQVNEQKIVGSIGRRIYVRFISIALGYMIFPIFLVSFAVPCALIIIQHDFLLEWSRKSTAGEFEDDELYSQFNTYTVLACGAIVIVLLQLLLSYLILNHSGKVLHDRALLATMRSPIRWFDNNPIGMIINRFTKDAYYMDEVFPIMFIEAITIVCGFCAFLVIIFVASFWSILGIVPMLILMVWVLKYYTTTSVELRRIEATKRSPLFSHLSHTLVGLTTIRASGQIPKYEEIHFKTRDEHSAVWMMLIPAGRWLALRLDLLSCSIVTAGTFFCMGLGSSLNPGLAGLAIIYIQNVMGDFQYMIILCTEVENIMTSIERFFEFAELPPEPPLSFPEDNDAARQDKDNLGVIEFKSVSMRYAPESPYVLRDVTFKINPGEKIGIVGRTGAGKSSLIQALFRMVEVEGNIFVNGTMTRLIGLHKLRCCMSIIPQETLLFSESLRMNLDPFSQFSDNEIWDVLEHVELKDFVSRGRDGIQMKIQEGGGNLSAGQRQLLCLARALLRKNKILVIDEATANADEKTDKLIQKTIRERFEECTVLMIAHRINTVIDSDRIIVMDNGTVVELDTPAALLDNVDGIFYNLARETGKLNMLIELAS